VSERPGANADERADRGRGGDCCPDESADGRCVGRPVRWGEPTREAEPTGETKRGGLAEPRSHPDDATRGDGRVARGSAQRGRRGLFAARLSGRGGVLRASDEYARAG